MKVLFTGGGTGGHVFPIIAIVREMRKIYTEEDLAFHYIGPQDNFSPTLLSQEDIKVKIISAGKIRRYFSIGSVLANFIDVVFKIPFGIIQAFLSLYFLAPDVIFSKGGYGSIPVVIAGWLLRIPIFLHESDFSPGLANRFLSRFALETFVSFPKTEFFPLKKRIIVGNPIRRELLEGTKEESMELLKLSGEKPVILIFGGSQGAQKINETIYSVLAELLSNFEIIHQCGEKNFKRDKNLVKALVSENLQKYYHLFPFLREEELRLSFHAADIIVGRAGSGSIFEIAALGKPSVLIPIVKAAQDHQYKNAYVYAETGAAFVIEEANLTSHFFMEKLRYIASSPDVLRAMSQKAKEFSRPRSAKIIASYILEYLKY
jgi:UDP-N-acetylglucosamine--N-acetylmuramyl-(pentapeptide) pyrophosphoryl-undecaprenol N-acetylglucosamine transferase